MTELGFLRGDTALPYCKGCGHGLVLRALGDALATLRLSPRDVAVVTDIGCVGLADSQIDGPHTIHTTHGRSTAFAAGIALADAALGEGRLKTIVMIGDGGSMIGINHLIFGAVINADVTVLVHNNFLFGMTGGQNSAFSPIGFVTATTKAGNPVPPLDLGRLLIASRAPFVARKFATDSDLAEVVARAVEHPGFAVVEILELCTAHGTRWNALTGSRMKEMAAEAGYETGILSAEPRPSPLASPRREQDLAAVTRTASPGGAAQRFASPLRGPRGLVVAGSAGERVQSAATILAEAAILSGLRVTQKNDNPVTQGTGFSLSELIVSPREIHFTGIERPDAVLVASADGARELLQSGVFARVTPETFLLIDRDVSLPDMPCPTRRAPLRMSAGGKGAAAAAIALWLRDTGALTLEAYWAAMERKLGGAAAETRKAVERALAT